MGRAAAIAISRNQRHSATGVGPMTKIVSIHSYRGGTGKSNTTANLATAVALTGKRVGIVDTDIQSPGIHVIFDLDEKKVNRSLNDYLWGQCPIEDTSYQIPIPEVLAKG